MPVSDFECQIVRGQIGRYLDGGVLSPVALAGLEEHLAECADCKATVAERRAALLGTLGKPTHAVVSMPVENPLVAALRARAAAEAAPAEPEPAPAATAKAAPRYAKTAAGKGSLTKPLALAGLLALVLLGMGRLSRTATAPNARASAAFVAESLPEVSKPAPAKKAPVKAISAPVVAKPAPAKTVAPKAPRGSLDELFVSKPATNPDARESSPVGKKPDVPVAKVATPPASPRPRVARPARAMPRKVVRRRAARRKTGHHALKSTVRVYGLDGRPLEP